MSIHQLNLYGYDKIQVAVMRLQEFEPPEGYYLAFSGGKDSCVIKELANMAKVKYDAHYNVTTIDPPDLVWFIKKHHKDVIFDKPLKPFLTRLVEKGFPRRQGRWCCQEYKERGGIGRLVVTGIRTEESSKRKHRRMVEVCMKEKTKKYLHCIIDWSENEVWEFIKEINLPYCKLYDEGWKRIGCLFCPFQANLSKVKEIEKYPNYEQAFRKAFNKLYATGRESMKQWNGGDEMFDWWLFNTQQENDLPLFS